MGQVVKIGAYRKLGNLKIRFPTKVKTFIQQHDREMFFKIKCCLDLTIFISSYAIFHMFYTITNVICILKIFLTELFTLLHYWKSN